MTLGEVIAERDVEQAGIESAGQEAFWIVERVLPPRTSCCHRSRSLSHAELAVTKGMIERRVGREPLQYILGTQEFCGAEKLVNPAVLLRGRRPSCWWSMSRDGFPQSDRLP